MKLVDIIALLEDPFLESIEEVKEDGQVELIYIKGTTKIYKRIAYPDYMKYISYKKDKELNNVRI